MAEDKNEFREAAEIADISAIMKDVADSIQHQKETDKNLKNVADASAKTEARTENILREVQATTKQSISLQDDMIKEIEKNKEIMKKISSGIDSLSLQILNAMKGGVAGAAANMTGTAAGIGPTAASFSPAQVYLDSPNLAGVRNYGENTDRAGPRPRAETPSSGDRTPSGVRSSDIPLEGKAFLDALTAPGYEGTSLYPNQGYNTVVGGGQFQSFKDHPRIFGVVTSAGPSSAAGRYQITKTTWDALRKQYPGEFEDFSPENQDKAAWFLAQDDYQRRTGRNLLEDLQSGDPEILKMVERGLAGTWSSLSGGVHQGSASGSLPNLILRNIEQLQQEQKEAEKVQAEKVPEYLDTETVYSDDSEAAFNVGSGKVVYDAGTQGTFSRVPVGASGRDNLSSAHRGSTGSRHIDYSQRLHGKTEELPEGMTEGLNAVPLEVLMKDVDLRGDEKKYIDYLREQGVETVEFNMRKDEESGQYFSDSFKWVNEEGERIPLATSGNMLDSLSNIGLSALEKDDVEILSRIADSLIPFFKPFTDNPTATNFLELYEKMAEEYPEISGYQEGSPATPFNAANFEQLMLSNPETLLPPMEELAPATAGMPDPPAPSPIENGSVAPTNAPEKDDKGDEDRWVQNLSRIYDTPIPPKTSATESVMT